MAISGDSIVGMRLFKDMSADQLQRIASRMTLSEFPAGAVMLSRNQPAQELYVILAGSVRVELQVSTSPIPDLTVLGPGDLIGERAILTDLPRTSDVRALSEVRAARLASRDFDELLHEIPLLYANLSRILAGQVGDWAYHHVKEEDEHREVITSIIGWQLLPEFGAFPGCSSWVRLLNQRLKQLGATHSHVLIVGEWGTWKDLAARLIHCHGAAGRPLSLLDCGSPPPVSGGEADAENPAQDSLQQSIAQEAALFGHLPEGGRRARRGMVELAAGGDLILRNVDCLAPAVQQELVQFLESGQFKKRGGGGLHSARVRIIATSGKPLQHLVDEGRFNAQLHQRLGSETVALVPLRERKKDVPVIAWGLLKSLNAKHQKQVRRFSEGALNRLVDHDWPLNTSELYQVISRAVVVCNHDEIRSEHIFVQGRPFGDGRLNLLTLPRLERLAQHPGFPRLLRWCTIPLFLLVTLYTLFGPRADNPANLAAWTLGWPALLLTAFLFARGWCSFCPLEGIGEFIGVTTRVVHDPPAWLRRWGPAASFFGLIVILLVEQGTGMFSFALATGLLLSVMLLATVCADLVIGCRGWCKFLCPLGRIVSLVSRISPLEMHSNHNVCLSRCNVDECIKEKACPMGLHPTGIDSSDHCLLCLNCVRNCPHHSPQLDLRNPTWGVYNKARRGFRESLFSVALLGVVLAAKTPPLLAGHGRELLPTMIWTAREYLLALVVLLAFTGLALVCSAWTRGTHWRSVFTTSGLAYLPLAAAGLFMLYFRPLVEAGARLVPLMLAVLGLDRWLDAELLTPELGTLRLLIYPLLVAAAVFSWTVLGKLQSQDGLPPSALVGHRLLIVLAASSLVLLL